MSYRRLPRIEKITKNCFFVQKMHCRWRNRESWLSSSNRESRARISNRPLWFDRAKTLPIGEKAPSVKFSSDDTDPPVIFVKKTIKILGRYIPSSNVSGLSVAAIRYPAPEGRFSTHRPL